MVDATRIDHGMGRDTRSAALIHSHPTGGGKRPRRVRRTEVPTGVRQFSNTLGKRFVAVSRCLRCFVRDGARKQDATTPI